jgi:hypothetical protein
MFTIAILDAVRMTQLESHSARADMPADLANDRSRRSEVILAVRRDSSSLLRRFAEALEPSS